MSVKGVWTISIIENFHEDLETTQQASRQARLSGSRMATRRAKQKWSSRKGHLGTTPISTKAHRHPTEIWSVRETLSARPKARQSIQPGHEKMRIRSLFLHPHTTCPAFSQPHFLHAAKLYPAGENGAQQEWGSEGKGNRSGQLSLARQLRGEKQEIKNLLPLFFS